MIDQFTSVVPTALRIRRPRAGTTVALLVLAVFVLAALWPGLFTGADPNAVDLNAVLRPPDAAHWFGTDQNGRDLYARVIHGARPSLLIGAGATTLALLGGIVVGTLAAQTGRIGDQIISRVLDVVLAVPGLLLVFLIAAALGAGGVTTTIGLALGAVPGFARVVRSEVLRVRATEFVAAAYGLGRARLPVVIAHIVPNAVGPVLAIATISLGSMVVAGSSLSFVGLGPRPPTADWGAMIAAGREFIAFAWWPAVFPGLAITALVLALTAAGRLLQARVERRNR
jgi:peptide/nickel transport system permease protein